MEQSKWATYLQLFAFVLFWSVICFLVYTFIWSGDEPENKPIKKQEKAQQVTPSLPLSDSPINQAQDNPYLTPHSPEDVADAKKNLELYLRSYYEIEHNGPEGLKQDLAPYANPDFLTQFDGINKMMQPVSIQKLIILPSNKNSKEQMELNCYLQFSDYVTHKAFLMRKEANHWVVNKEEER